MSTTRATVQTEGERLMVGCRAAWVAEFRSEARRFEDQQHRTSRATPSPEGRMAFGIQPVPAGFLVREATVLNARRYGDEKVSADCAVEDSQ